MHNLEEKDEKAGEKGDNPTEVATWTFPFFATTEMPQDENPRNKEQEQTGETKATLSTEQALAVEMSAVQATLSGETNKTNKSTWTNLTNKTKEGKKKMKSIGRVEVPGDVFINALKLDD